MTTGRKGRVPKHGGHCCASMQREIEDSDIGLSYDSRFREYRIACRRTRGHIIKVLRFCPWCGRRLPRSLRNRWFQTLEALGIREPWFEDRRRIPKEFRSDLWWRDDTMPRRSSRKARR